MSFLDMLSSWTMRVTRALLTALIVAVIVFGPALFMASSPCLECDGICGAAATVAAVEASAFIVGIPAPPEPPAQIPARPVLQSELPPRPLRTTV